MVVVDSDYQRRSEARALVRLLLEEVGGAAGGIGNVHRAISDRVFAAVKLGVGPAALPVKVTHDAIAGGVYGALNFGARSLGKVAGGVVDLRLEGDAPLSETRRGTLLLGIVQGLRGDVLESDQSVLAAPMAVRVSGKAVPADSSSLQTAFPDATGRLVVFLHGLMENENAWRLGGRASYGERLAQDLGCTPIEIRYNTGRRISDNGQALSALLADLVSAWPVEVEQIALVGHSMGALVARSGCFSASKSHAPWVQKVRHVVCLGAPHFGAPLEQVVHYGSAILNAVPETRPFARLLRRRSGGIRDLFGGSLVDEDWRGRHVDELSRVACQEVPLLDGAMHCFVSAAITRNPDHPVGRLIGDGLVLVPSASGRNRSRRIGFTDENAAHLSGANHFTLLNHDKVYESILGWLQSRPEEIGTGITGLQ
jgi:pimeloyl-ACP methyl ester carboxylesterase